ncbi:electron transport complex subunit E [Thauera chlorobenzoica]|uniref:Ion-translocating oxidoreductase complex subunit E n=1 Tax=Thauera chlorobenzoica TaxID=96773 RepID=A0A1H5S6G7_9RHOO|nr:electron transport complex subunit E [Thauera chlorobenzoica]APR04953.1 Electron transport complex protein RnfE [Thauera chlorobenzoica]SEF45974.1 electron transport complex protein RnfE [Thauera chlorobenzoica]
MSQLRRITREGVWDNNIVLVQLLGMCPTLAVTGSATNGLGMGLATTAVLVSSGVAVSLFRRMIGKEVRIPIYVLLISSIVTLVDMSMNAWVHELHKVLGLFIPLIVVNCAIIGRAEAFASKQSPLMAAVDGLAMGVGFTLALTLLGGTREVIGQGTLFADASMLLGENFAFLELQLVEGYRGLLLMILPPGGFIALGFLVAARQRMTLRARLRTRLAASTAAAAS